VHPKNRATVLAAALLAASCWAPAQTKEAKPAPTTAPAGKITPEMIREWVKDMDHDSFTVRDKAVKELIRAGKATIPPVSEAAKGKSLEVTNRAIEVLKTLLASKDSETSKSARSALEKLAALDDHEAGKQAKHILQAGRPHRHPGGPDLGRIVLGGGEIRIGPGAQLVVGRGAVMRVAVKNVNGNREIDATENGKNVKIQDNKNGITVTVTEPAVGKKKPKPKVYKAANAAELKKKHPEAHKLYEKYAGKNAVAINMARIRIAPVRRPRMRIVQGDNLDRAKALIAEARKELAKARDRLNAAKDAKDTAKALTEALKQIDAASKKLAEANKKLK